MIELVMYGMIPSANTANLVSAPPENRLMNAVTPWLSCASNCWRHAATSTPGAGGATQVDRPRSSAS